MMDTKTSVDPDGLLAYAGNFGKYQYLLMTLFCVINVLSAFHYFGQTFIGILPVARCDNHTIVDVDIDIVSNISDIFMVRLSNTNNATTNDTSNCTNTFYDSEDMFGYTSITQQMNWTTTENWIPALGQSMFFVGSVLGSMALGVLADRVGRLHVLVIANLLAFCGNLLTAFTNGVFLYTSSRFIAGLAADSNFVMMYIIVMEYMRPNMRTFGLNLCIGVFYCVACVIVPWIAVLTKTWDHFLIIIAVPHLLVLGFYLLVPESAQWLLSKGRTEEAINCFKKIAIVNKRDIPNSAYDGLRIFASEHIKPKSSANLLGLFKTPKLRKKTCILIFKSMVITLCYDAISRNINGVNYSPFILFSITSVTILPACIFILILQDRIGRKAMASASLLLSGIFNLVIAFIFAFYKETGAFLTVALMTVVRFGINVAYNSSAQYAVELIPVEVRGQGVSAIHVAGYAASFFSSQLLYMGIYWKPFPEFILGILLITGAGTCLFLPETLNRSLPVTLEDGEQFGEEEKVWEFPFNKKRTESRQTLYT